MKEQPVSIDTTAFRETTVLASGLIYWGGVLVHAYRIRRRIGRSPNLRPGTPKEWILWGGWVLVVIGWLGQPLLLGKLHGSWLFTPLAILSHPAEVILGTLLILAGFAGTLWSYAALGDAWRIWVDRREMPIRVTRGPYRFVSHPVYLFQVMIVLGTACLLPTTFSFCLLLFLIVLAAVKATDEEAHLRKRGF